jgi:DNA-directed RNA polymerase specialized sigma24 family protein
VSEKNEDVDVVLEMTHLTHRQESTPASRKSWNCAFLGGLNFHETAEVFKVSAAAVARDWITARARLHREMSRDASDGR